MGGWWHVEFRDGDDSARGVGGAGRRAGGGEEENGEVFVTVMMVVMVECQGTSAMQQG